MRNDLTFRPELTALRQAWTAFTGLDDPAGGYELIHEMRLARRRAGFPVELHAAYRATRTADATAVRQPIRYAGLGEHGIFPRPAPAQTFAVPTLPATALSELCVLVSAELWSALARLSLWVEALCLYV